jgi:DNA-binding MarR family transcriptional regulator
MARRLVAARLISLIKLLYASAGPAYRTETGLPDLEWRVMTQVGERGPVVLTALAILLHQDKGQVSHAVKALTRAKLLAREHLRASLTLTKTGQALFERIVRLGRARNAVLTRELNDAERRSLPHLLSHLQTNARELLAREHAKRGALAGDPDAGDGTDASPPMSSAADPSQRSNPKPSAAAPRLVAQDLFALHNLLQRSAALTYRRETSLSDFEWRVLSQVGEHAPLTLIQLVPLLSRDKSQVGRTLARLEARGLTTREKIGGGRHILVGISEQGRNVYARLAELALERNDVLIVGLSARDQQILAAILDKLTAGANTLLARHNGG